MCSPRKYRLFGGLALLFGALLWWLGRLFDTRWYLHIMAHCWWIGFVAVIAGWTVTESGRQPWLVHGILRTADATSPVPAASIAGTLALFIFAYGIVFSMGIYYINRLIAAGPPNTKKAKDEELFSANPLSGAGDAGRDLPVHRRARGEAAPARVGRCDPAEQGVDHAPGPRRPDHARGDSSSRAAASSKS